MMSTDIMKRDERGRRDSPFGNEQRQQALADGTTTTLYHHNRETAGHVLKAEVCMSSLSHFNLPL